MAKVIEKPKKTDFDYCRSKQTDFHFAAASHTGNACCKQNAAEYDRVFYGEFRTALFRAGYCIIGPLAGAVGGHVQQGHTFPEKQHIQMG